MAWSREDQLERLDAFADGVTSAQEFLNDERLGNALEEQLKLLQAVSEPFSIENFNLMEDLKRDQELYLCLEKEAYMQEMEAVRQQLPSSFTFHQVAQSVGGSKYIEVDQVSAERESDASANFTETTRLLHARLEAAAYEKEKLLRYLHYEKLKAQADIQEAEQSIEGLLSDLNQAKLVNEKKELETAGLRKMYEESQAALKDLESAVYEILKEKADIKEMQQSISEIRSAVKLVDAESLEQKRGSCEKEWRREMDVLMFDLQTALERVQEKEKENATLRKDLKDCVTELQAAVDKKDENLMDISLSAELIEAKLESKELQRSIAEKDSGLLCSKLEVAGMLKQMEDSQGSVRELQAAVCEKTRELLQATSLEQTRIDRDKAWRKELDTSLSELQEARIDAAGVRNQLEDSQARVRELEAALSEKISLFRSLEQVGIEKEEQWKSEKDGLLWDLQQEKQEIAGMCKQLKDSQALAISLSAELIEANLAIKELQRSIAEKDSDLLCSKLEVAGMLKQLEDSQGSVRELQAAVCEKTTELLQATSLEETRIARDKAWRKELDTSFSKLQEAKFDAAGVRNQLEEYQARVRELEAALSEKISLLRSLEQARPEKEEQWRSEKGGLLWDLQQEKQEIGNAGMRKQLADSQGSMRALEASVDKTNNSLHSLHNDLLHSKVEIQKLEQSIPGKETELRFLEETRKAAAEEWRVEKDRLLSDLREAKLIIEERDRETRRLCKMLEEGQGSFLHEARSQVDQATSLEQTRIDRDKAWRKELDTSLSELQEARFDAAGVRNQLEECQARVRELEAALSEKISLLRSLEQAGTEKEEQWRSEKGGLLWDLQQEKQEIGNAGMRKQLEDSQGSMRTLEASVDKTDNSLHSLHNDLLHSKVEIQKLEQSIARKETEFKLLEETTHAAAEEWRVEKDWLLSDLQEARLIIEERDRETRRLCKMLEEGQGSFLLEFEAAVNEKKKRLNAISHELLRAKMEIQELRTGQSFFVFDSKQLTVLQTGLRSDRDRCSGAVNSREVDEPDKYNMLEYQTLLLESARLERENNRRQKRIFELETQVRKLTQRILELATQVKKLTHAQQSMESSKTMDKTWKKRPSGFCTGYMKGYRRIRLSSKRLYHDKPWK